MTKKTTKKTTTKKTVKKTVNKVIDTKPANHPEVEVQDTLPVNDTPDLGEELNDGDVPCENCEDEGDQNDEIDYDSHVPCENCEDEDDQNDEIDYGDDISREEWETIHKVPEPVVTLNKPLVQKTLSQIIKILDKSMPDDLRFAFDSKGFKISIQNAPGIEFKDPFTGEKVRCGSVVEIRDNNIEMTIASEMSRDIKNLLTHSSFDAIVKYSFSVYKIQDGKIFFAKAVATR